MLKAIFGIKNSPPAERPDFLSDADSQLMASLLCNATSLIPFTKSEAKIAASYMSLRSYREGHIIVREGDATRLDRMMWILEGEVTFEALAGGGVSKSVTVRVLDAGAAFGFMSLFDNEPRLLQGTASLPSRCALLTRDQLQALCQQHPQIGTKLMAAICFNFSQALRGMTTKFKCHVRLNNVLNAELMDKEKENTALEVELLK